MSKEDIFGLGREHKLLKSNVRDIFTPHQPIRSTEFFFGREAQVQRLIEHINTPGQHAILYGDRGVGKTSLANIASNLLLKKLISGTLWYKQCDSDDTFESIIFEPLENAGFFASPSQSTSTKTEGGDAGLDIKIAKAGVHTKTAKSTTIDHPTINISPATAVNALKDTEGLLLIDEADAIKELVDKRKLAEFVKLLSDRFAKLKILLVGIAETSAELTANHPSVARCLKETKLDKMSTAEIRQIIVGGARKLKLTFAVDTIDKIVQLSAGYPYFTHLLCLRCAEDAIVENRNIISIDNLRRAIDLAVGDIQGTLRKSYEDATRSADNDTYRLIVLAAALLDTDEFNAEELRNKVSEITGKPCDQNKLNNHFSRLMSTTNETILRRLAKGVYRFNDPRMPSYVKIANHIVD